MKKVITYCFLIFSFLLHAGSIENGCATVNDNLLLAGNCNVTLENPPPVTTSLLASFCNITLPTINTLIGIHTVAGGPTTRYRIKATNGSQVQIIERGPGHFTMTLFPICDFATTYTIEIELQRAGIWVGTYGPPCTITTPPGLGGMIIPELCGVTLKKLNSIILTPSLQFVTGYRFRVTNLTDPFSPFAEQILERSLSSFTLAMLEQYNYGMTYKIEVALKTFGMYGPYGMACNVSTPAPPKLSECNATIVSGNSLVSCASMPVVNQYRFQIIRDSDYAISIIDRTSNYFNFDMLPAATFTGNEMYHVRVSVMTSGTWSPFGESCEIVSPANTDRLVENEAVTVEKSKFEATAYPNPFHSNFTLKLEPSDEITTVKVFDMLGRLVESKRTKNTDREVNLGANFPTGVYSVIVSRGDQIKTVRVVKR